MKASSEASRDENDALLLEIDTMEKQVEALRHGRKKFLQQIEEKRNANKKLHTLLAREEQSKSHCFEELAAVRLQLSSLSTVHKHQKASNESSQVRRAGKPRELCSPVCLTLVLRCLLDAGAVASQGDRAGEDEGARQDHRSGA
jgi:DNA-binding protein H-NS